MMDAEKWKDTILAKSREYVEIGVSVASDLTEKGKTQAKILSNQAKINKAQRQLGALVYSLAKGNEENQPLVDKYIEAVAEVEKAIEEIKANMTPEEYMAAEAEAEEEDILPNEEEEEIEEEPVQLRGETKTCPVCKAEVDGDALFCNHCGAQL